MSVLFKFKLSFFFLTHPNHCRWAKDLSSCGRNVQNKPTRRPSSGSLRKSRRTILKKVSLSLTNKASSCYEQRVAAQCSSVREWMHGGEQCGPPVIPSFRQTSHHASSFCSLRWTAASEVTVFCQLNLALFSGGRDEASPPVVKGSEIKSLRASPFLRKKNIFDKDGHFDLSWPPEPNLLKLVQVSPSRSEGALQDLSSAFLWPSIIIWDNVLFRDRYSISLSFDLWWLLVASILTYAKNWPKYFSNDFWQAFKPEIDGRRGGGSISPLPLMVKNPEPIRARVKRMFTRL